MIEKLDEIVVKKLKIIIENDINLANRLYKRWGVTTKDIESKLNDYGLHGGVWSKKKSIENLSMKGDEKVLNIGPEIGTETLMLAEISNNVSVTDPDKDSLSLLRDISKNYVTERNVIADKVIRFYDCGFKMDSKKIEFEKNNYNAVFNVLGRGLPTYYDLSQPKGIKRIGEKYDVIFIHKILTTLKRFTDKSFEAVFFDCVYELSCLLNKGVISWTEPSNLLLDSELKYKDISFKKLSYLLPQLNERYSQFIIHKTS